MNIFQKLLNSNVFHVKPIILLLLFPLFGTCQIQSLRLKAENLPEPLLVDSALYSFDKSQTLYSRLDPQLQHFYYLVNYSRLHPVIFWDSVVSPILKIYPQFKGVYSESLKADLAKVDSLSLLKLNSKLILLSQEQASDITSTNSSPSHFSSTGVSFSERMQKANIKFCAGENISMGKGDVLFALFLLYLDYNLPDLGHRKALLNKDFTETGLGIGYYQNQSYFIVQDFSCSQ